MARANNKLGETFFPLTEKAARKFHSAKLLSTPLYLLVIKSLFTKPNADFVISNVTEFCKEWGISKSAFYRAVNTLTALGELAWEATEGVVLKPNNKVATIPQAGHRPMSGTPSHERDCDSHERDCDSHERDCDSHERDCDSHERDCDSHERDTGMYKDRVRDRSSIDQNRSKKITPLTPQGEPESACVPTKVEVEVLAPEPEFSTSVDSHDSRNTNSLNPDNKNNSEDKSSAAPRDNKRACGSRANGTNPWAMGTNPRALGVETRSQQARERLARDIQNNQDRVNELVERFESGEVVSFPRDDLRLLAGALIGDMVALYRLSGDINHGKQKDIDPDFVAHVEFTLSREARNASNAIGRIRNCEENPLRWRELIELVATWQGESSRPTSTNGNSMSTDDFFALASEYEQGD